MELINNNNNKKPTNMAQETGNKTKVLTRQCM